MNSMPERVTLADVARLAGVSKTSASMALAGNHRVAELTRTRVHRAAEELGYVPHFAASSLRSQRADSIAVVLPHATQHVFSHPVFIEMLEGITGAANELDLAVILSTARSESDERSAYSRITRGGRAAGVIVAATSVSDSRPKDIHRTGYPVVVVGRTSDVASVGIDDLGGAEAVTRHLIDVHGSRRIAHVSGPLDHQSAIDKRDGWVAALRNAGLTIDPRLSFEGDYEEASGARAADALAAHLEPGDAVFFANDQMATGAIDAWRRAGVEIPGSVAIVAYDNHPMSRYTTPPLTTVGADMVGVGEAAVHQLARLIEGETDLAPIEFPTEVIVRESCGCAPHATS
ncbi:LacI family DNA-binding transcriptional regulator [Diaminobutyricibacter sp. McL0618]|uniref:LacI family DNA-binding transcriptional regulator n=1 Tax=Leifsonia sp. McL0618 TaxID=3415677 RepID=UPI003CEF552A